MNLQEQLESAISHHQAGRLPDAEKIYRLILSQHSDNPDALHLLGVLSAQLGKLDAAVELIRRAVLLKPGDATANYDLGKTLIGLGRLDEAIASLQQAIRIKPDYAEAYSNLGIALKDAGRFDEAISAYREAIRLNPKFAEAHNNLGNILRETRQYDAAIAACRQAILLKPGYAKAHNNLGNALKDNHQLDEAISSYREAIRLQPDYAEAHGNLGIALKDTGQLDDAIASCRQAVHLKPDSTDLHRNLVLALHYHPAFDARMIHDELRRWNQRHAQPLKIFIQPHINNRDPDRRLRIGYVSPDFRDHVVGLNLLPLLREHDHRQTEIFCYANMVRDDAFTDQIRHHADIWRSIAGMSDSRAADLIRLDQIDILVDLALHTAGNRLLVFARKPAPVQVTYLGYCSSTGLETMDYRLSDPHLDPVDSDLSVYSERTIRLPETYWCYANADPATEPSPSPALAAGFITFGCLNNFAKVAPALDLWVEILRNVPHSRLIVHSPPGTHLNGVRHRFTAAGVSPDRLEFPGQQPRPQYLRTYQRIDIALDPFPWCGGITTCDALWMGVPVITLVGRTAVGRGGASILANIGLPELIAPTPEQYLQIATTLAKDLPRLADLRRTLRPRMQASPLMDAPRFARNIEAAYRRMWRTWCTDAGNPSSE